MPRKRKGKGRGKPLPSYPLDSEVLAEESDEEHGDGAKKESKGQMKHRHKRELKEWRKQAEDEYNAIPKIHHQTRKEKEEENRLKEEKILNRQQKELLSVGEGESDDENNRVEAEEGVIEAEKEGSISDAMAKMLAMGIDDDDGNDGSGRGRGRGKKSRQQRRKEKKEEEERQRRAMIEEESKNVISQRQIEMDSLMLKLKPLGLKIKEIPADGDCLFNSISDQLKPTDMSCSALRKMAADEMRQNEDSFRPFTSVETDDEYAQFCDRIASSHDWGGQLELRALSQALKYV